MYGDEGWTESVPSDSDQHGNICTMLIPKEKEDKRECG